MINVASVDKERQNLRLTNHINAFTFNAYKKQHRDSMDKIWHWWHLLHLTQAIQHMDFISFFCFFLMGSVLLYPYRKVYSP